jgi:hypothetical protein
MIKKVSLKLNNKKITKIIDTNINYDWIQLLREYAKKSKSRNWKNILEAVQYQEDFLNSRIDFYQKKVDELEKLLAEEKNKKTSWRFLKWKI